MNLCENGKFWKRKRKTTQETPKEPMPKKMFHDGWFVPLELVGSGERLLMEMSVTAEGRKSVLLLLCTNATMVPVHQLKVSVCPTKKNFKNLPQVFEKKTRCRKLKSFTPTGMSSSLARRVLWAR